LTKKSNKRKKRLSKSGLINSTEENRVKKMLVLK